MREPLNMVDGLWPNETEPNKQRTVQEIRAYVQRAYDREGGDMDPDYYAALSEVLGFIDGEFD